MNTELAFDTIGLMLSALVLELVISLSALVLELVISLSALVLELVISHSRFCADRFLLIDSRASAAFPLS